MPKHPIFKAIWHAVFMATAYTHVMGGAGRYFRVQDLQMNGNYLSKLCDHNDHDVNSSTIAHHITCPFSVAV